MTNDNKNEFTNSHEERKKNKRWKSNNRITDDQNENCQRINTNFKIFLSHENLRQEMKVL